MEELKLVLQTLATLADGAKEGFIWWLVIDRLVPTLMWAAFGGGMIGAGWYAIRKVSEGWAADNAAASERHEAIKAIRTIRGLLGVYTYQSLQQDSTTLDRNDYQQTVDAVRVVAEQVAVTNARKQAAEK